MGSTFTLGVPPDVVTRGDNVPRVGSELVSDLD